MCAGFKNVCNLVVVAAVVSAALSLAIETAGKIQSVCCMKTIAQINEQQQL